ncbi:MAG: hypothetical protein GKR77_07915 [Legionellales bacterium]|nr:hypothetical protein [Legionellales bacterium]
MQKRQQSQTHHAVLYGVGLFFTLMAFFIGVFSLYILPFILFQSLHYNVPLFVVKLHQWFIQQHQMTGLLLVFLIWFPFVLIAGLCGYLARWINAYIETEQESMRTTQVVYDVETARARIRDLVIKLSLTGLGVIVALLLFEYLLLRG